MLLKPKKRQKSAPQPPSPPSLEAKPALSYWYYLDGDNQVGPMSLEALKKAFIEDKVQDSTYVWSEELPDWQPLDQLNIYKLMTQI